MEVPVSAGNNISRMSIADKHPNAPEVWAPRRQLSLAKARRRSAVVGWLRRFFVIGSAICVGIFVGFLAANAIMTNNDTIEVNAEELVMLNPRFTGRDEMGEPYVITADSAERHSRTDDSILLHSPRIADQFGGLISAPKGVFDQDAQTLELVGNVVAADPSGYVFSSSRARIYLKEGRIEGLNPLKGNGPIGDFASKRYEILEDGSRLVMTGDVEITLYPTESDRETAQNAPQ